MVDFWGSGPIFMKCGIGDVIAIEPYLPPHITDFYWCDKAWHKREIRGLFQISPHWRHVTHHVVECHNSDADMLRVPEYLPFLYSGGVDPGIVGPSAFAGGLFRPGALPADIRSWPTRQIFDEIERGELPLYGDRLTTHELCACDGLGLPREYAVIHPYSTYFYTLDHRRQFDAQDWTNTSRLLHDRGLAGVVVNVGEGPVPVGFIDLSNRTTLAQAIEVVKGASMFVGIDSSLFVVACRYLAAHDIVVKSRNGQYFHRSCLYTWPLAGQVVAWPRIPAEGIPLRLF